MSTHAKPKLALQTLEDRTNPDATLALNGGELAVLGSAGADALTISRAGDLFTVTDASGVLTSSVPGSTGSGTGSVTFPGSTAFARLLIDLGAGDDALSFGSLDLGGAGLSAVAESISFLAGGAVAGGGALDFDAGADFTMSAGSSLAGKFEPVRVRAGRDAAITSLSTVGQEAPTLVYSGLVSVSAGRDLMVRPGAISTEGGAVTLAARSGSLTGTGPSSLATTHPCGQAGNVTMSSMGAIDMAGIVIDTSGANGKAAAGDSAATDGDGAGNVSLSAGGVNAAGQSIVLEAILATGGDGGDDTTSASGRSAGDGAPGGTVSLNGGPSGDVRVNTVATFGGKGGLRANGNGSAGGGGGAGGLTVQTQDGSIDLTNVALAGGDGGDTQPAAGTAGDGGSGGAASFTAGQGDAKVGTLITRGGDGGNSVGVGGTGGNAGSVKLAAGNGQALFSTIFSRGGDGGDTSKGTQGGGGGSGASVTLNANTIQGQNVFVTGGMGGDAKGAGAGQPAGDGGNAGSIAFTASAAATKAIDFANAFADGGDGGDGAANSNGGSGGNAGSVTLKSPSGGTAFETVRVTGGTGGDSEAGQGGGGGSGASVQATAGGGILGSQKVTATGGDGGDGTPAGDGGNAGSVTFKSTAQGGVQILVAEVETTGGAGGDSDSGVGGDGGNAGGVKLTSNKAEIVAARIDAKGGVGGTGDGAGSGGNAASVTVSAQSVRVLAAYADGGAGGDSKVGAAGAGGSGGALKVTADESVSGVLFTADGGAGGDGQSGGGSGGNAGQAVVSTTKAMAGTKAIDLNLVAARGGDGGDGTGSSASGGSGGNAGSLKLTAAQGDVRLGEVFSFGGGGGAASGGTGGGGGAAGSATLRADGGMMTINFAVDASGGDGRGGSQGAGGGGSGAAIKIDAAEGLNARDAEITAAGGKAGDTSGGANGSSGGPAGSVTIDSKNAQLSLGTVTASGGFGSSTGNSAGSVNLSAQKAIDYQAVRADGGGSGAGDAASGGTVKITSRGGSISGSKLTADGGDAPQGSAGSGGSVTLDMTGKGNFDLVSAASGEGTSKGSGGTITFKQGFFNISGDLRAANVNVQSGADISGAGTAGGNTTVGGGGSVSPGNSPGTSRYGTLTLQSGSKYNAEIDGTEPGTGHDQIITTGKVVLENPQLIVTGAYTPQPGDQFVILRNTSKDATTGNFSDASGGTSFMLNGVELTLSYDFDADGDGVMNDIVLRAPAAQTGNRPPVAADDAAATSVGFGPVGPVTIDVLANDSDPDGDPLTVGIASQPSLGTAVVNADNTVSYTPSGGAGTDTFTYTVSDGQGGSATGTVTVTVLRLEPPITPNPTPTPNRAPVAQPDSASAVSGPNPAAVVINVLGNDSDPDGNALAVRVAAQPTGGTAVANANGTVTYTPNPRFSGTDTFTYSVSDGNGGSAIAAVTVTVAQRAALGGADTPLIALGSTDGRVRVVNSATGAAARTFAPFGDAYAGEVRTAVGDLNGDGVPDIIAGAGSGGGPRVAAFDGQTGARIRDFFAFESGFRGGVYLASADLDRDGFADLVVGAGEGGGPRVRVFSGRDGGVLSDYFAIEDPAFRGGVRPTLGDFNGDGTPDLAAAAGEGGGPRVAVWDGASLLGGDKRKLVGDFFAFAQGLRDGVFLSAADTNGDGRAELAVGAGPGGGPRVLVLDGAALARNQAVASSDFFAGNPASRDGARVAFKSGQSGAATLLATDGATTAAYRAPGGTRVGDPLALDGFDVAFVG